MKCTIISNGKLQLCLSPETELEKIMMNELFKVEVQVDQHSTLQIVDKTYADVAVISHKALQ